jgi:heme/copper-type cytochrome/quinol oxidase subunit 2
MSRAEVLRDVVVVLAWFLVAGLVAGVVWWLVADPPQATRAAEGVVVEPQELTKQVSIDGWYFVVAAVGGLLSGIALLAWRHRDPLLMVVLVTLGGGLAALVSLRLGHLLGPGAVLEALRGKPQGAHALEPLTLHATGMEWVWPATAAMGALVHLWVLRKPDEPAVSPDAERVAH